MKNLGVLVYFSCLLLCSIHARSMYSDENTKTMFAKGSGITVADLDECLNKVNSDFETIMELASMMSPQNKDSVTQETIMKVGCCAACIYKKNGMMVNSKIIPDKAIEIATQVHQSPPEELVPLRVTLQTCSNRVSNMTNDCNIVWSFSTCVILEMQGCRNGRCH